MKAADSCRALRGSLASFSRRETRGHLILCKQTTMLTLGSQMVVFYMVSSRVKRSLVYGNAPRNRLDLYLPPGVAKEASKVGKHAPTVPVVIYITGAVPTCRCFSSGVGLWRSDLRIGMCL